MQGILTCFVQVVDLLIEVFDELGQVVLEL